MKELSIELIRKETLQDSLLNQVIEHVKSGKKPTIAELYHYQNIFPKLSISETGLLIRQHRLVLPQSLLKQAISKAQHMGHFGCAGLKRQLRAHFHFPHLNALVEQEVKKLP